MTTEITTNDQGMHIHSDPVTGAIAASPEPETLGLKPAESQEEQKSSDPRKSAMDIIYANRAKTFEKELELAAAQGFGATHETIKEDEEQPETEEVVQPKIEKEETTPDQLAAELQKTDLPKKRVVMVEGRPIEFTEEEYSKLAERGLFQPQIQAAQAPLQQPQVTQPKKAEEAQPDQSTDLLRDIARRITYGNEEESTKALADLINAAVSKGNQNQTNPQQIAQLAAQQALAQIQFQNNLDTIAREYKDVYEKRASTLVAADYVNSLRYKYNMLGTPKNDLELWREACDKTREDFGLNSTTTPAKVQQQTTVQSADLGNKLERKRAAPKTPTAATKTVAMEQQRSLTGSDIVAAMRKSRGQASA